MANTLTAVVDKLLAMGLMALRENAIMPLLVNRGYEETSGEKGSTIDVPLPGNIVAVDVTPANTPPSTTDIAPTSVAIPLDQWKEAPFYLTDKERMEVMAGLLPMQASAAVKAIANTIDIYLMKFYRKFYGWTGTAGTTPFASDITDATAIRVILNKQLAPLDDRRFMLDPDAEGKALNLAPFRDASQSTDAGPIIKGQIGTKLGFDWYMDQNVQTHASTALTAGATTVNGAHSIGVKTVSIAKATNTSPLVEGDIITFAGDTQTYVVTADVTLAVGNTNVAIEPGLKKALAGSEAVTLKASHVCNLAFHRDAIAFANRPLTGAVEGLGNVIASIADPLSRLTLRLEVSREHKRTRWSYDVLYGGNVIRRELGARLAG